MEVQQTLGASCDIESLCLFAYLLADLSAPPDTRAHTGVQNDFAKVGMCLCRCVPPPNFLSRVTPGWSGHILASLILPVRTGNNTWLAQRDLTQPKANLS